MMPSKIYTDALMLATSLVIAEEMGEIKLTGIPKYRLDVFKEALDKTEVNYERTDKANQGRAAKENLPEHG